MLKITTPYGSIKYGKDIEIPLTITNPMFNDKGSHSLPFTIPLKPNRALLGFPDSLNNKAAVGEYVDCTIEHTDFFEKGTLKITDIGDSEIELSLTTREGAFWEWAKEKELRDIETSPDRPFNVASSFTSYFDKIWPQADMAFFPIITNKPETDNTESLPSYDDAIFYAGNEYAFSNYNILNAPKDLMRARLQALRQNITGFLYVKEVLKWIMNNKGFKYGVNDLDEYPEFNRLVVLNSATQPFRNNYTHLNELLPSGSVLDFIEAIEKSFACQFFFNSAKKTLDIKFFKNIISANPKHLIGYFNSSILASENKQITLQSDRIDSEYTVVSDEFTEEYIRSLNIFLEEIEPIREHNKVYATSSNKDVVNNPEKVVFNIPTQCYFALKWEEKDDGSWEYKAIAFQSRFKDYILDNDDEKQEIKCPTALAPMVKTNFRQFYNSSPTDIIAFDYSMLLPHFNVELQKRDENILDSYFYNKNVKTPITFAFNRGKSKVNFPTTYFERLYPFDWKTKNGQITFKDTTYWDIPWGSTDVYSSNGVKMDGNLSEQPQLVNSNIAIRWVGEFGLYETFYREYEQFFRKSNKEVKLTIIDFKKVLLSNIYEKWNILGVNFIIDNVEITLKANTIEFDSATGYTLKPYS